MVIVAWQDNTGAVLGSYIGMHGVTMILAIVQVRITNVGIQAPPGMRTRVVREMEHSVNCKVASSGLTYLTLVTLLTSHAPMSWSNADAP